jgi:hypothetical protein
MAAMFDNGSGRNNVAYQASVHLLRRVCWPGWNICVTNDHGYVPLVVNISRSFPHSWLITECVTRLTQWMPLVEEELPSLPEHHSSPRLLVVFVLKKICLSFSQSKACWPCVCPVGMKWGNLPTRNKNYLFFCTLSWMIPWPRTLLSLIVASPITEHTFYWNNSASVNGTEIFEGGTSWKTYTKS